MSSKQKNTAARTFCFTLNNYTPEELASVSSLVPERVDYICFGKEEGNEAKTPHLQGYLYKKSKLSLLQCKDIIPRAHFETAKGNLAQNIDYTSKEGKWTEYGQRPIQGHRTDIHDLHDSLKRTPDFEQVVLHHPAAIKYFSNAAKVDGRSPRGFLGSLVGRGVLG